MQPPGSFHVAIERAACLRCAGCVSICPARALDMRGLDLRCTDRACIGCDLCVRFCPVAALRLAGRPGPRRPQAFASG